MSRRVKKVLGDALSQEFEGVHDMLVVNVAGIDAVTDGRLRAQLKQKKIRLRVVQNRLAGRALRAGGLDIVADQLKGPSALVWGGESIVGLAKEMTQWAKRIEALKIKGGASEGRPLSAGDVEMLSKLPSREELIGRVVGCLLGPAAQIIGRLMGPGARLAGQIQSRAEEPLIAPTDAGVSPPSEA